MAFKPYCTTCKSWHWPEDSHVLDKWPDVCHETHKTRVSDASSFDEICERCGARDIAGSGWGSLRMPCRCTCAQPHHLPVWHCAVHGEVVVSMD